MDCDNDCNSSFSVEIRYFIFYTVMSTLSLFQFLIFEALVSCFWASKLINLAWPRLCTAEFFFGRLPFCTMLCAMLCFLDGRTGFDNKLMPFVSNYFKYD